jgi:hypothetical protein
MKRALSVVGGLCAITLGMAGVGAAHADVPAPDQAGSCPGVNPIGGTDLTLDEECVIHFDGEEVVILWGFDYNPSDNNLRAYTNMDPSNGAIHTQAEPLALGDNNGVLKSKNGNSQSGPLVLETDAVSCHKPSGQYNSNLHFAIRWADGSLHPDDQTGENSEHAASVVCT